MKLDSQRNALQIFRNSYLINIIYQQIMINSILLEPSQLKQTLNKLQILQQQNEDDLFYLQNNLSMQQTFNKILYDKMQIIKQILSLTISSIHCVQDLKQQKQELQKNISVLRNDIQKLCDINFTLQQQIDNLFTEMKEQTQQFQSTFKTKQILQFEKSIIRKQLQSTKFHLQKIILEKDKKIQSVQIALQTSNFTTQSINHSLTQQKQKKQEEGDFLQDNIILNKKYSRKQLQNMKYQWRLQQITCKKSVKSLKTLSYLSSKFPGLQNIQFKNKLSQQSFSDFSLINQDRMQQQKWRTPIKLDEDLLNLNLTYCESTCEITPKYSQVVQPKQQSFEISIQKNMVSIAKNNQKQLWNRIQKSDLSLSIIEPVNKIEQEQSAQIQQSIDNYKINNQQQKTLSKILVSRFKNLHQTLFNLIVKDRIQPRRTIRKNKSRKLHLK